MNDDDFVQLLHGQIDLAMCIAAPAADLHSSRMLGAGTAIAIAGAIERLSASLAANEGALAEYAQVLASSALILRQPLGPNHG